MSLPSLHPLQLNAQTGEPFLRLPAPHQNIIITPIRPGDEDAFLHYMNDPGVYENLASIPHPYTRGHAQGWIQRIKDYSDRLLEALQEPSHAPDKGLKGVDGCPVMIIREVKEDGQDVFLGDLSIVRSSFIEIVDEGEKACLSDANKARPAGDSEIVFTIGDYLVPSHHGRGIMSLAVRTLIQEWAVPRMNCHKILLNIKKGNIGSRRVFEKNGFTFKGVVENHLEITAPGRVGGPKWSLEVFEWTREE